MSFTARALAALLLVAALVAGWWRLTAHYERVGYDRAKAEDKAAAEEQATSNRELQRAAEKRYVVQAETRDRFIVTTTKEIAHAAAPLSSCPVPADAVRLLDAARGCALGDPGTPCGVGDSLPGAR